MRGAGIAKTCSSHVPSSVWALHPATNVNMRCLTSSFSRSVGVQVMVHVTEEEQRKVAVHCHAGLGRTGFVSSLQPATALCHAVPFDSPIDCLYYHKCHHTAHLLMQATLLGLANLDSTCKLPQQLSSCKSVYVSTILHSGIICLASVSTYVRHELQTC